MPQNYVANKRVGKPKQQRQFGLRLEGKSKMDLKERGCAVAQFASSQVSVVETCQQGKEHFGFH